MSDLVAFLRVRLDEDVAAARAWPSVRPQMTACDLLVIEGPARALREVQAKRAVITRYEFACRQADVNTGTERDAWEMIAGALERDVVSLAGVYREHPDYDPEWADAERGLNHSGGQRRSAM